MEQEQDGKLIRIFYIVIFYLVYSLSEVLVLALALIQTLLNLSTGEPSTTLREFGASLGQYMRQIINYVSYASAEKPYPFADWPEPDMAGKKSKCDGQPPSAEAEG